ncbi:MAG: hypothetical protein LDL19_06935 [Thiobacillus sp.]|nr:hypothetical protein [Thiobacillus sp.]
MSNKTLIAAAVGTAFVAGMSAAPVVSAAENPFALSGLSSGYQVADHNTGHSKMMKEGKCGEGKCGEGKCGAKAKAAEGMCGMAMADANKDGKVTKEECDKHRAAMFEKYDTNKDGALDKAEMAKMTEGMCGGAKAKMKDGKCGEGKCGGMKK